jgi:hypothetical protein
VDESQGMAAYKELLQAAMTAASVSGVMSHPAKLVKTYLVYKKMILTDLMRACENKVPTLQAPTSGQ